MAQDPGAESGRPERWFRIVTISLFVGAILLLIWSERDRVLPPVTKTIVVYSFSTMEEVMNDGIFPAFQEIWREDTGERVEFVATFAGSGALTGKIIERLPAEVAVLSSKLDVFRLARSGVTGSKATKDLPYEGVLAREPLVIVVREGNPKNIRDFADLAAEDTSVLHTDPTASGSAQWSILAEYGSAFLRTGDREAAFAQLLGIWKNVTAQAASARAARIEFGKGTGDALITYEQDVIGTPGRPPIAGEIVYPRSTIICEHTAVQLDKNITDQQRRLVDAFFEFLWSRQAQQIFVDYGFRSPVEELNPADPKLGVVELPFTLQSLGGPLPAQREILDALWRDRVLPELGRGPQ